MRKRLISIVVALLMGFYAFAQVPGEMKSDKFQVKKVSLEQADSVQYVSGNPFKKSFEGTVYINPADQLVNSGKLDISKWKQYQQGVYGADKAHAALKEVNYFPCLLTENDSIGAANNSEYIEFRSQNIARNYIQPFYLKTEYVTNEEYAVFKKYVADSISRRILGNEAPSMFLTPVFDNGKGKVDESNWNLNWGKKIDFNNPEVRPLLRGVYYPPHENYYNFMSCNKRDVRRLNFKYQWLDKERAKVKKITMKEIDQFDPYASLWYERSKSNVRGYNIEEIVNIYPDTTVWIRDSTSKKYGDIDDVVASLYNWHPYFKSYPVVGLNAPQAQGFLAWKQKNHQMALNKANVPLRVEYSFPSLYELDFANSAASAETKLEISAATPNFWRITNQQYEEFVVYTRDSIARRVLCETLDYAKYSNTKHDIYGDELTQDEWNLDWSIPLDLKIKDKEHGELYLLEMYYPTYERKYEGELDTRKFVFEYYWYDLKKANALGEQVANKRNSKTDPILYNYKGKNKRLDYLNSIGHTNNVLGHQDRSRCIIKELINVYPGIACYTNLYDCDFEKDSCPSCKFDFKNRVDEYDFKTNPGALIKNITYHQAKAYYHWRIREHKNKKLQKGENPIYSQIIPTEVQWNKIMKGETVTLTPEKIQYPTPRFRYVVRVFPIFDN
jgi:formylglycine-generating enzyme required for sulfatase activity